MPKAGKTRNPGARWARVALLAAAGTLIVSLAPAVRADVVFLKNGKEIEGQVSSGSSPGKIRITLDLGSFVEISETEVERIERKKSPSENFDERFAKLREGELDAHLELSSWARERRLHARERKVYQAILRFAPNNAVAREGLGFVVHRNRWIRRESLRTKGLVRVGRDWFTVEERDQRYFDELRRIVEEDLRGADSDNRYVQEYSINEIQAMRNPWVRHALIDFVRDSSPAVRIVAIQTLATLTEARSGEEGPESRKRSKSRSARLERIKYPLRPPPPDAERKLDGRLARELFDRTLSEETAEVRKAVTNAVMRLCPPGYFDLAMTTCATSRNALHRERAAEGAIYALKLAWVPRLFDALGKAPPDVPRPGNPAIRRVLRNVFKQDFEYDVDRWKSWWVVNSRHFRDE